MGWKILAQTFKLETDGNTNKSHILNKKKKIFWMGNVIDSFQSMKFMGCSAV
jgi:hypothetical protein